jgi:hypothetical protein
MNTVTKQEIMEALGRDKTTITDELVTTLNTIILDEPEVGSLVRENFLTYGGVLQSGRFSVDSYLNAVKFCSYKLMNMTNQDAYKMTYPDRYENLRIRYVDVEGLSEDEFEKKVSSYVYAVAKSQLVVNILSQVQIPTKLLNMGLLQEAINVEATLMRSAKSEIVKEKAANTLIQYLGQEEENKIQIDIGVKKDDIIEQYEVAMKKMVEEQLVQIKDGADVKQIANAAVMEAEVIE